MENSIFKCPKCGKKFERNPHYYKTIDMQSFLSIMYTDKTIKDMCMSCNYIELEKEE